VFSGILGSLKEAYSHFSVSVPVYELFLIIWVQ